jgi:hypothetical protein
LAMHTKLNKLFPYDSPTMLFGILPKNWKVYPQRKLHKNVHKKSCNC